MQRHAPIIGIYPARKIVGRVPPIPLLHHAPVSRVSPLPEYRRIEITQDKAFSRLGSSLLFSAGYYLIVWTCCSLGNQLPGEGHVGCSQVWGAISKAAIHIHVQGFFCGHKFSTSFDKYRGVWLLDHMVKVCLVWWESVKVSSTGAVLCATSPATEESSSWSPSSPEWGTDYRFGPLSWVCSGISFLFQLVFPWWQMTWNIFFTLICHLCIFFGEASICIGSGPFLNRVVYFLEVQFYEFFCVFWIPVLYLICLSQIFSSSMWLVFSNSWHCLSQRRHL